MVYSIIFHELVWKEDLKKIDKADQKILYKTIQKKLSTAPEVFGKPLSHDLAGFWSLRVGQFRVIYTMRQRKVEVIVLAIGFRRNKESYLLAGKRLAII